MKLKFKFLISFYFIFNFIMMFLLNKMFHILKFSFYFFSYFIMIFLLHIISCLNLLIRVFVLCSCFLCHIVFKVWYRFWHICIFIHTILIYSCTDVVFILFFVSYTIFLSLITSYFFSSYSCTESCSYFFCYFFFFNFLIIK